MLLMNSPAGYLGVGRLNMEYKEAINILTKMKDSILEYDPKTHLTNNINAGQLYVALVCVLNEHASQQLNPADIESLATEIHEQVHNGASISDVMQLLSRR